MHNSIGGGGVKKLQAHTSDILFSGKALIESDISDHLMYLLQELLHVNKSRRNDSACFTSCIGSVIDVNIFKLM